MRYAYYMSYANLARVLISDGVETLLFLLHFVFGLPREQALDVALAVQKGAPFDWELFACNLDLSAGEVWSVGL